MINKFRSLDDLNLENLQKEIKKPKHLVSVMVKLKGKVSTSPLHYSLQF